MKTTLLRAATLPAVLLLVVYLAGCAPTPPLRSYEEPPMHTLAEFDDEKIAHVDDPWERFNRRMYTFNYNLDQYLFLPVVNTYEFVTPKFVRTGVSNFFKNIGEICTLYNSVLQLRGKKAATTTGRFLINSTIGLAGLFDPATSMDSSGRTRISARRSATGAWTPAPTWCCRRSARGHAARRRRHCGGHERAHPAHRRGRTWTAVWNWVMDTAWRAGQAARSVVPLLPERLPVRVLGGPLRHPEKTELAVIEVRWAG